MKYYYSPIDNVIDSARCGGSTYILIEHGIDYYIIQDGNFYKSYRSLADAINYFKYLK